MASEEALNRFAQALSVNVGEGGMLKDFAAAMDEALGEGALSPGHIENVFRTNVSQAYSTGLMEVLAHPFVSDEFPYLQYTAVHDSRVRPEHREMERLGLNGTSLYRRDDPIWQQFTLPWDYQCRCSIIPLSVEDAAAAGVREAREWMHSGMPPAAPEFVPPPPFNPPAGWNTRGSVRLSVDDEGNQHDKRGRFAPKGKGGSSAEAKTKTEGKQTVGSRSTKKQPAPEQKTARQEMRRGLKGLLHTAGRKAHLEMKKSERAIAGKIGKKRWQKLPGKLRKSIAFAHAASQKVLYAIDTPLRMGLNLAKTVARERGLPEQYVQKVARVVNAVDQLSTLPVVGVYTRAAKMLTPALGPIAGYIPVAALSYVAYSTARNPFATIRAARHLLKNFRATVTTHLSLEDKEAIADLLAAYDRHAGDDWFDALLHAALDETRDLGAAIRLAEEGRRRLPPPGSTRLALDDEGNDHGAAGSGKGGQFVKQGRGEGSGGKGPQAAGGSGGSTPNPRKRPPLRKMTVRLQGRIKSLQKNLAADTVGAQNAHEVYLVSQDHHFQFIQGKIRDIRTNAFQIDSAANKALQEGDTKALKTLQQMATNARATARKHERLLQQSFLPVLQAQIQTPARVKVSAKINDPNLRLDCKAAADFLSSVVSRKVLRGFVINARIETNRTQAEYDPLSGAIKLPPHYKLSDILHEAGHLIEIRNPKIMRMAQDFLDMRCKGEKYTNLKAFGLKNEWGRKDDFEKVFPNRPELAYYVGKHYSEGWTEVITSGLDALFDFPATFAGNDPEYFKFVTGVLSGRPL